MGAAQPRLAVVLMKALSPDNLLTYLPIVKWCTVQIMVAASFCHIHRVYTGRHRMRLMVAAQLGPAAVAAAQLQAAALAATTPTPATAATAARGLLLLLRLPMGLRSPPQQVPVSRGNPVLCTLPSLGFVVYQIGSLLLL